ncbi:unnamed protein product [Ectocarpus sp. CCAP 1310/34]|nr:unnamed protein product [Ectocarpus sp. CCAP 1310/34]
MTETMWEWDGPESERLRPRARNNSDEDDDGERGMPLPLMSPLWREHGKGQGGGGIHIVVCCCNETQEELKVMLSTFRIDATASCLVRISFVLDPRGPAQASSETDKVLKRLLRVTDESATEVFGCIHHSGTLDKTLIPFDLYVKGPSLPVGKRNSLVTFFNDILPVKMSRGEAVEPDAVYLLDADSGHPVNGLQDLESMWRLLMAEEEVACVTCPVRPVHPMGSFLAASQSLEFALWDNVGESHFGVQTTCRGAQCMFKYRCLVEDGRLAEPPIGEGAMPPLLNPFSKTAAGLPALILLDSSPSEGLLVLLRQRGFDVRSCGTADGVTCVPCSWIEFYAQRRRWYAGSLVAVSSHLTGKESYFQAEWHRWIISSYAFVANLFLHSGLALMPVLLAKGLHQLVLYDESRGESDDDWNDEWSEWQEESADDGIDQHTNLDWIVFALVWGFFLLNVGFYLTRSQDQLWMWINVTSVLWMLLCGGTLVGSGFAVSPLIPVMLVIIPPVLAGLNTARGTIATWRYLCVAAVPFVLLTTVNSVLVFLYALATLDSTEWGTRDVGSFDSGVSKPRAASMRRRKLCILFTTMATSCALGVVMMISSSLIFLPIVIGIPSAAYLLKLLLVVVPAKLERSRQTYLLGDVGSRPLSLRGSVAELAPINGCPPEFSTDRHSGGDRNGGGIGQKGLGPKSPAKTGSHVTAEDGTPSPGGMDVSTSGSFFGAGMSVVGDSSASGPAADGLGHRRHGSKSASISSGFAGVAGVGGGGIGGGDICWSNSAHATGSRQSSAAGMAGSGAGGNTSGKDGSAAGRPRARSRSPSDSGSGSRQDVSETAAMATQGRNRKTSSALGSGLRASLKRMNSRGRSSSTGPSSAVGDDAHGVAIKGARRTGFARFLSAKDSVEGITLDGAKPTTSKKAEIRKAWGLRKATSESDDSTEMFVMESLNRKLNPHGIRGNSSSCPPDSSFAESPPPAFRARNTALAAAPAAAAARAATAAPAFTTAAPAATGASPAATAAAPAAAPAATAAASATTATASSATAATPAATAATPAATAATPAATAAAPTATAATPAATAAAPTATAAMGAPADGEVRRYSWACPQPSTSEFDAPVSKPDAAARAAEQNRRLSWGNSSMDSEEFDSQAAINTKLNARVGATSIRSQRDAIGSGFADVGNRRRPPSTGTLAGIRAAWGTSIGGSQDDIACRLPETKTSTRNSRLGAVYATGIIEEDEENESEMEEVDPRLFAPGVQGNRRRSLSAGTLAGIRAAWGSSLDGSQEDIPYTSTDKMNVIHNPRVGVNGVRAHILDDESESENEFVDSRSLMPGIAAGRRRPLGGGTLAGIRAAWGNSMGESQDDIACPSPATSNTRLNSRAGVVYSRGGDRYASGHVVRGQPMPAGMRNGRGQPGLGIDEDDVIGYHVASGGGQSIPAGMRSARGQPGLGIDQDDVFGYHFASGGGRSTPAGMRSARGQPGLGIDQDDVFGYHFASGGGRSTPAGMRSARGQPGLGIDQDDVFGYHFASGGGRSTPAGMRSARGQPGMGIDHDDFMDYHLASGGGQSIPAGMRSARGQPVVGMNHDDIMGYHFASGGGQSIPAGMRSAGGQPVAGINHDDMMGYHFASGRGQSTPTGMRGRGQPSVGMNYDDIMGYHSASGRGQSTPAGVRNTRGRPGVVMDHDDVVGYHRASGRGQSTPTGMRNARGQPGVVVDHDDVGYYGSNKAVSATRRRSRSEPRAVKGSSSMGRVKAPGNGAVVGRVRDHANAAAGHERSSGGGGRGTAGSDTRGQRSKAAGGAGGQRDSSGRHTSKGASNGKRRQTSAS